MTTLLKWNSSTPQTVSEDREVKLHIHVWPCTGTVIDLLLGYQYMGVRVCVTQPSSCLNAPSFRYNNSIPIYCYTDTMKCQMQHNTNTTLFEITLMGNSIPIYWYKDVFVMSTSRGLSELPKPRSLRCTTTMLFLMASQTISEDIQTYPNTKNTDYWIQELCGTTGV